MWRNYYYPDYNPKPRKVKGGIKAHTKRGSFGQNWWSKLWVEFIEYVVYPEEYYTKGRAFARRGQVASIKIEKGIIVADVYDTSHTPYHLTVHVKPISVKGRKYISRMLAKQPAAMAELLAGKMPKGLKTAIDDEEFDLFPAEYNEIEIRCQCYMGEEFCKHAVAACLLAAEEFDRDPFLALKMIGIEREELLKVAGITTENTPERIEGNPMRRLLAMTRISRLKAQKYGATPDSDERNSKPLSMDPDEFWGVENRELYDHGGAGIPEISAALPKRLGNFPLWRSKIKFAPTMEKAYKNASLVGLAELVGVLNIKDAPPAKRKRGRPKKNPA